MTSRSTTTSRRAVRALAATAVLAFAFASSAAAPAPSLSQRRAGFGPKVQQELASIVVTGMVEQRLPGVNVGVWIPGRGSWVRSFGTRDLKTVAPMRLDDHVRIASITKTFTATAVLQLVDEGRLSLDDRLSSYVQGVPNGNLITLGQLLGMTAGTYDFTMDQTFAKQFDANPLLPFSSQQVIAILKRHKPAFSPGRRAQYSDTNYILLGLIIEKVTGLSPGEVIRDGILRPLGLRQTSFPTTPEMPAPSAHGYYAGDSGQGPLLDYTASNPAVAWTAGAMISTLGDLRVWAKALATRTLLTKTTQAERLQFTPFPNPGDPSLEIGYGLGILRIANFIGHNGAIFGYSSAMFYLPSAGATIVVVGNKATNFSGETLGIFFNLAKYLFPRELP